MGKSTELTSINSNVLAGSYGFSSETSLYWSRSAASTMATSYGTLDLTAGVVSALSFVGSRISFVGNVYANPVILNGPGGAAQINTTAIYTQLVDANGITRLHLATSAGDSSNQYYTLGSNVAAGHIFRGPSAASVMLSITSSQFSIGVPIGARSGISVGNATAGGTLIPGISSTSSLVAPFVVQPSASSFTIVTWTAAQPGDHILVTPHPAGTVSSLSSGLVAHSHCTQAGQVEFRLSNVSTLAQNQSQRTWYFTRISPF